jgi:membrane fusion protein, multidrug efflux system
MFAKGGIVTARSPVMPLVPLSAVRDEQGRQVVYRIDQGNVVAQPVKLGLRNEDLGYAEVTEGLAPGAQVIVAKLEGVKPGVKVKAPVAVPAPQPPSSEAQPAAALAQRG